MSSQIQELDNTVRAFYEGKGDVVSYVDPRYTLPMIFQIAHICFQFYSRDKLSKS